MVAAGTFVLVWLHVGNLLSLFYVAMLVAPLTTAVAFGLRFEVGRSDDSPRVVINRLMSVLETIAPVQRVDHDTLIADVGKWITIVITAKETKDGSVVTSHAGLSEEEWTTALNLILILSMSVFIFAPMALIALRNTVSFAAERVAPAVSSSVPVENPVRAGGAREIFSEALDEGVRLIWRARKGVVSQYHDRLLLSGTAAILVMLFSILGLLYLGECCGFDLVEQGLVLPIALLNSVMTLVSLVLLVRRDSMRKIRACDSWAGRFASAMPGTEPPVVSSASGEGSLELLVRAAHEIPAWLKAGDHGEYYREPGLWLPLAYMLLIGSSLMFSGSIEFDAADTAKSVPFLLGVLLVGLSVLMYAWWAAVRRRVNKRVTDDWARRAEALRRRMETYLQGL